MHGVLCSGLVIVQEWVLTGGRFLGYNIHSHIDNKRSLKSENIYFMDLMRWYIHKRTLPFKSEGQKCIDILLYSSKYIDVLQLNKNPQ